VHAPPWPTAVCPRKAKPKTQRPLLHSSDRCVIGSPGFLADAVTLQKRLQAAQVMYEHDHGRPMSCPAMAQVCPSNKGGQHVLSCLTYETPVTQLLSNTLYYKRFFPYYAFNICAGLDEQGTSGCPNCTGAPYSACRT